MTDRQSQPASKAHLTQGARDHFTPDPNTIAHFFSLDLASSPQYPSLENAPKANPPKKTTNRQSDGWWL